MLKINCVFFKRICIVVVYCVGGLRWSLKKFFSVGVVCILLVLLSCTPSTCTSIDRGNSFLDSRSVACCWTFRSSIQYCMNRRTVVNIRSIQLKSSIYLSLICSMLYSILGRVLVCIKVRYDICALRALKTTSN